MKTAGLLGMVLYAFIYVGYHIQYGNRLMKGGLFPAGTRGFSLLHSIQNGSGACPASYSMGTVGFSTKGKVAVA
jgi:hypothetical protein